MTATALEARPKRVLLAGVFGPFGVDDDYGRRENIMELFHNQVTKGQGAASFRFFHRSFGLYFLAENIEAETTVLDFPSQERFVEELQRGYDVVGISFIAPNFRKARRMAELVRRHLPEAEIILGGHGAAIEGVEELIDCDHVVKGEGIRWLRSHLGQDPCAPFVHPVVPSTERKHIWGVPVPGATASLLVPGVGCVNGCSFCATSHFFGKRYESYLGTGQALFDTACRIADESGTDAFFIMDENFLKDRERAMELLELMEQHQRFFRFHIFSSAEAITAFGLDNMVRLGVTMAWIGFESQTRQDAFAKNVGIDAQALVKGLRDRGISVLGSGILCMEHHTPDNMQQDIDFLVGLETDLVQFMLLTPMPVTALYQDHKRRGLLREDLPLEEWHGQKHLAWRHPHFAEGEPEEWIHRAFKQDHLQNSSTMYRVAETSLRGFLHLESKPSLDANLSARRRQFEDQAREYCLTLAGIAAHAVNETERSRAVALERRVNEVFGAPGLVDRVKRVGVIGLMARWRARVAMFGDGIQPRTIVTRYPYRGKALEEGVAEDAEQAAPETAELPRAVAAMAK